VGNAEKQQSRKAEKRKSGETEKKKASTEQKNKKVKKGKAEGEKATKQKSNNAESGKWKIGKLKVEGCGMQRAHEKGWEVNEPIPVGSFVQRAVRSLMTEPSKPQRGSTDWRRSGTPVVFSQW
jgi:hypothetical protein